MYSVNFSHFDCGDEVIHFHNPPRLADLCDFVDDDGYHKPDGVAELMEELQAWAGAHGMTVDELVEDRVGESVIELPGGNIYIRKYYAHNNAY